MENVPRAGWLLFTDNRNASGHDSLEATLQDSWMQGNLPVITASSKSRFEHDADYRTKVAAAIAEIMMGVAAERAGLEPERYCSQPRIYVPLQI